MITLKQALEDKRDRMVKQVAETLWEIERATPMQKGELNFFLGEKVTKEKYLANLELNLKERRKNVKVADEMLNDGGFSQRYDK